MDIKHCLESGHNKKLTLQIVKYVGHDKQRFTELITLFLKGDKRISQRAAWSLSYVAEGNPRLIEPYLKRLITKLEQADLHPAIARNILRILQDYDLPERYHGELIDICFRFILNTNVPIAIRAFALTTAAHIATKYPELKNELLLVIEELQLYPQSAALTVRIRNALRTLRTKA